MLKYTVIKLTKIKDRENMKINKGKATNNTSNKGSFIEILTAEHVLGLSSPGLLSSVLITKQPRQPSQSGSL